MGAVTDMTNVRRVHPYKRKNYLHAKLYAVYEEITEDSVRNTNTHTKPVKVHERLGSPVYG